MTTVDDAIKVVQDLADQACNGAKDKLKNVAPDAAKEVKDNLQKGVDTACNYKSGADQERIQDTKRAKD